MHLAGCEIDFSHWLPVQSSDSRIGFESKAHPSGSTRSDPIRYLSLSVHCHAIHCDDTAWHRHRMHITHPTRNAGNYRTAVRDRDAETLRCPRQHQLNRRPHSLHMRWILKAEHRLGIRLWQLSFDLGCTGCSVPWWPSRRQAFVQQLVQLAEFMPNRPTDQPLELGLEAGPSSDGRVVLLVDGNEQKLLRAAELLDTMVGALLDGQQLLESFGNGPGGMKIQGHDTIMDGVVNQTPIPVDSRKFIPGGVKTVHD